MAHLRIRSRAGCCRSRSSASRAAKRSSRSLKRRDSRYALPMATEPPSAMPPRKIMSLLSPLLGAMAECERRDGSALRSDTAPAGLAALADHAAPPDNRRE